MRHARAGTAIITFFIPAFSQYRYGRPLGLEGDTFLGIDFSFQYWF